MRQVKTIKKDGLSIVKVIRDSRGTRYMKIYRPSSYRDDEKHIRQTLMLSANLHHPSLQSCKRVGRTIISKDYGPNVNVEWVRGRLLGQLRGALKYLDRLGLVYTDLKSGNLCLRKGRLTIIDLEGICRTGSTHFSYTWCYTPGKTALGEAHTNGVRKDWHWEILELLKNKDNVKESI